MMFSKVLQNSQESTCAGVSFWKNSAPQPDWKEIPTLVFSCEILRAPILKNFRGCMLTNLFYENEPLAPRAQEKITAEVFVSLTIVWLRLWCYCTSKYLFLLKQIRFPSSLTFLRPSHTWSVLTDQISIVGRLNYKFSMHLTDGTPNKLICIQVEIVLSLRHAVKLNLWKDEGSSESQKSVSFD